ncbi:MAG: hypothetical protein R2882_09025 [Gemmatimonadales bacterium]
MLRFFADSRRAPGPVVPAWLALAPLLLLGNRPDLYEIPLSGTGPSSRMTGTAVLTPARSPFGLATTKDGRIVFNIAVEAPVLPPPNAYGAQFKTYVAWAATADLDRIERIGALSAESKARGKVAMNKFLVVITAEPNAEGAKWSGPIVMRGNSPSSFLSNFSGHTMFNGGVPQ